MYVELHCHSAYSFLDGASLPEELLAQAEALGYPALALTDHDGLYGAMEFAKQARGRGLQPITGAEVTLEDGSHVTLLAETRAGYANLCRLLSTAHLEYPRPTPRGSPGLPRAVLAERAEGLVLLSGCRESEIGRALERGDLAAAEAAARRYRAWFGREGFFLELQQNHVRGDTARLRALAALAARLELETVATGNVHYHCRERHRLQDALVAVRHRQTLDDSHRARRANSEFHLRPPEEMARLFAEAPRAVENTLRIAERCRAFDLTQDLGYTFPDFAGCRAGCPLGAAPGAAPGSGAEPADTVLARLCEALLAQRYAAETAAVRAAARRRVEEELELIRCHRLSGFFLVYRDLMELAKEVAARVRGSRPRGRFGLPPGRGRGSSVASVVCYLIGLSPVDPIRAKLSLGRFLNRELASVPDIDLDFPRDIREALIREVHERYGREHVAMVCAYPTYRVRSAVRDLGLALGLPAADVDRLARLCEGGSAATVAEELARLPGFAADARPWRHLEALARELAGFPRHLSQHSGGLILSSCPLVELVPVEHSRMEGRRLCQWDKDSCDDARFIKIDFLALGMLSAVEECLDLIEINDKPPVDLTRIDFNDPLVYDRICAGDTIGVFQIESRAQIQMLPRTQPRNLDDLAVEVAIVRPGPIVGGAVNPYVRRRERMRRDPKAGPSYDHRLLIPVLKETLGVILYQDQVLGVCQALAGFSVGKAEGLRRAMSRRRSRDAMEQYRAEFLEGAAGRGVHPRTAGRIFDKLLGFSNYGFPKSHAAAFAVLAYQSVWLCHYYPTEFVASLLNNQPMGFYPRDVLLKEAQRHEVSFLRPDVNESAVGCTVHGETVRLGLRAIGGLGQQAAERIAAERAREGPFRSLPDFVRRVALPVAQVESLVLAGAFDRFGLEQRALLWQLGLIARAQGWMNPKAAGTGSRRARQQVSLSLSTEQDEVPLRPLSPWERMLSDYRLMELSPDVHPLALLRPAFPKGMATTAHLRELPDGKEVRLAGLVVTRQRPGTAKGFLFLLVEDEWGLANVVVTPQLYERHRAVVRGEPLVWLRGTVQHRNANVNLILAEARSLLDALTEEEPGAAADTPEAAFLNDLRRTAPRAHQWR